MRQLLYVEDDNIIRTLIACDLQAAGFELKTAIDLQSARSLYQTFDFDLILLDLSLPDGNGFEWAQELKRRGGCPHIIFLTSHTDIADIRKGFELGGADYVKKPFEVEELVLRIKRTLHDYGTGSGMQRNLGDYIFNPETRELTYKGETTLLSYLQGSVLDELSDNPGMVIGKTSLLEKYWGGSNYFTSRNLDSVIVKLRNHFKSDPRVQFIACKGEGYRLIILDSKIA